MGFTSGYINQCTLIPKFFFSTPRKHCTWKRAMTNSTTRPITYFIFVHCFHTWKSMLFRQKKKNITTPILLLEKPRQRQVVQPSPSNHLRGKWGGSPVLEKCPSFLRLPMLSTNHTLGSCFPPACAPHLCMGHATSSTATPTPDTGSQSPAVRACANSLQRITARISSLPSFSHGSAWTGLPPAEEGQP